MVSAECDSRLLPSRSVSQQRQCFGGGSQREVIRRTDMMSFTAERQCAYSPVVVTRDYMGCYRGVEFWEERRPGDNVRTAARCVIVARHVSVQRYLTSRPAPDVAFIPPGNRCGRPVVPAAFCTSPRASRVFLRRYSYMSAGVYASQAAAR